MITAHAVMCLDPVHEYMIRRDLIVGFKAPEFSVSDKNGEHLLYRIESRITGLQKLDLIAYPSKEIVARLNNKVTLFLYEANFETLDPNTKQWISGTISQNLQILNHKSSIEWNGRRLSMEHNVASLTTRFFDEQNSNQLLAEYKVSVASMFWATKYSMLIYTNELPEAIFFFGLAARDYITTQRSKRIQ